MPGYISALRMEHEEKDQGYMDWKERLRKGELLECLEDITSNPSREQERILAHILRKNAETEYLKKHKLNGAVDVKSLRECLPISDYDTYRPYVERIYGGELSPILCSDPVVEILTSSGTTGGDPKLFPVTAEALEVLKLVSGVPEAVLRRDMPALDRKHKYKVITFSSMKIPGVSPGGLPCQALSTSILHSSWFKKAFSTGADSRSTVPYEVMNSPDNDGSLYCQILLGLLQREEVLSLGAIFPPMIIKALQTLEDLYTEFADDIANGTLSSTRVKDETVRSAVMPMLQKDPELAEFIRKEFELSESGTRSCSDGIIGRIWPNVEILRTVATGSMAAYLPALASYSNNLPVMSSAYVSTEGFFGLNLHPVCPTDEIFYTLIPFMAYFEFIPLVDGVEQKTEEGCVEVVDLVSVKKGQDYELLVTIPSGFCRYRMGDVLKVVGSYNESPTFKFMGRRNRDLSVYVDKTDEYDLQGAVSKAAKLLQSRDLGLRLADFTSTADCTSKPGHYVIFWELQQLRSSTGTTTTYNKQVLEKCCSVMEASLNAIYREGRYGGAIGPLEMRLVSNGTFDLLADHACASGASPSQYKTPRILSNQAKSAVLLQILNSKVALTVFSQEIPPSTPGYDLSAWMPVRVLT